MAINAVPTSVASDKPKVLIVEDEDAQAEVLRYNFQREGFDVLVASDGDEGLFAVEEHQPDLVVLDWMLPGASGISICQRLRGRVETRSLPIIMLTARSEEQDRIRGFESGADDYVVKPFNPRELVARARAVLRRAKSTAAEALSVPTLGHCCRRFAGFLLDLTARRLIAPDGNPVALTNAEFLLLQAFVNAPRRVLSRDQLLDLTRSHGGDVFDRTIDVLVLRLRRKIEPNPHAPHIIRTERGAGYVFDTLVEDV